MESTFDGDQHYDDCKSLYAYLNDGVRSQIPSNALLVIDRQHRPPDGLPVLVFPDIGLFFKEALRFLETAAVFLLIARLYDTAYLAYCRYSKIQRPVRSAVDIAALLQDLRGGQRNVSDKITVKRSEDGLCAQWESVMPINLSALRHIDSLPELFEKSRPPSTIIAGGGGSDIISASLLFHIFSRAVGSNTGEENTAGLLISTRTRITGSQGKPGSKAGEERKVTNPGGQAKLDGHPIPDTYQITPETSISGRALEHVPLSRHEAVYLVLDQTGHTNTLPPVQRTDLQTQYRAAIASAGTPGDPILSVDTGGDVLSADPSSQDFRVQSTLASLPQTDYPSLTTAILCPGVDAPSNASAIAAAAGARVYSLRESERKLLLELMREYRMDGSDPERFGKTSLCLQMALRGRFGWQVLDLPEHVVMTGENPWGVFEHISPEMARVVFVETRKLVEVLNGEIEKATVGE